MHTKLWVRIIHGNIQCVFPIIVDTDREPTAPRFSPRQAPGQVVRASQPFLPKCEAAAPPSAQDLDSDLSHLPSGPFSLPPSSFSPQMPVLSFALGLSASLCFSVPKGPLPALGSRDVWMSHALCRSYGPGTQRDLV